MTVEGKDTAQRQAERAGFELCAGGNGDRDYAPGCTHLIVGPGIDKNNLKLLCARAAGIWVLSAGYLDKVGCLEPPPPPSPFPQHPMHRWGTPDPELVGKQHPPVPVSVSVSQK